MKPTQPLNLELMDLTRERINRLPQVKVTDIYDGVTQNFHDDGLFSTRIFGEVGSEQRDMTFGYIKLNTTIFHPYAFSRLKRLKRLYEDILLGSKYAVFDKQLKDFIPATPLEGETGYAFFMRHWDELKLKKNDSAKRNIVVDILNKHRDNLFLKEYLVLPAGLRDLTVDKTGKTTEDEVNELYRRMISLSNSLTIVSGSTPDESQDVVRRNLQKVANEIYDYFKNLFTGKKGFGQGKWGGRNIYNGTANVISSMDISSDFLGGIRSPSMHDTHVGLWQTMKGALPLSIYLIKNSELYQRSFTGDMENVYLVNKDTLRRERVEADQKLIDQWQSTEGLEKQIDRFGKEELRNRFIMPFPGYYLGLIYKDEEKFQILSDIEDLPEGWSKENVKPITYIEFFYLMGYNRWYELKATLTRYPVAGNGSIYPTNVYVRTTTMAKALEEYKDGMRVGDDAIAREFPLGLDETEPTYFNTIGPHPVRLGGLSGDFDGDRVAFNILVSDDAIEEINAFQNRRESIVGVDGKFLVDCATETVERVFSALTGEPTHVR